MLNSGDKIGLLTLIKKEKRTDKKWYWLCKCECGNKKWIRADSLTKKNPTCSCGCLAEKTQLKSLDLAGKRFGKLTAIKATSEKRNNSIVWECKCDCGNITYVAADCLSGGKTKSCGCKQDEQREKMRILGQQKLKETDLIEGTSILHISNRKLLKNNRSGVKGVHWDNKRQKWVAQIEFKGKHYNLGRYTDKEDAIKARKEAEEKMFGEFLKWYKENKK